MAAMDGLRGRQLDGKALVANYARAGLPTTCMPPNESSFACGEGGTGNVPPHFQMAGNASCAQMAPCNTQGFARGGMGGGMGCGNMGGGGNLGCGGGMRCGGNMGGMMGMQGRGGMGCGGCCGNMGGGGCGGGGYCGGGGGCCGGGCCGGGGGGGCCGGGHGGQCCGMRGGLGGGGMNCGGGGGGPQVGHKRPLESEPVVDADDAW
jgi:hypothetical protein